MGAWELLCLEVSMNQQNSPGWLVTILLVIFVPIFINYFTGITTPFIRFQLSRIAIWPSKRRLRILEEALSQARNFSQNATAFYQYCLREAFLTLCFLSFSLFVLTMFYLQSSPMLPPTLKDLTFLERLALFLDRSSVYMFGATV